jgi:hypothetical protein
MAFATVEELDTYLGETVDVARAVLLLDLATARIVSYVGHPIAPPTTETITLDGTGTDLILLPGHPVTDIDSITVNGVALTYVADAYEYVWSESGAVRLTGANSWGRVAQSIEVTYTHGYATVPDDVKAVCLQMATRGWHNPAGLRSESLGGYSYSSAIPATGIPVGLNLTDDERDILDRYRFVLVG